MSRSLQQQLAALNALEGAEHDAAAHKFLCHVDGSECKDGCDVHAEPKRLALYQAVQS